MDPRRTLVLTCLHCWNETPHQEMAMCAEHEERGFKGHLLGYVALLVCQTCNKASLYWTGGPEGFTPLWPMKSGLGPEVPERVRQLYGEAVGIKARSPSSFAVQVRRALEAMCKAEGFRKKVLSDNLGDLVSATFTSGGRSVSLDWSPDEPKEKRDALTSKAPDPNAEKKRTLPAADSLFQARGGADHLTILFSPKKMGTLRKAEMAQAIMARIVEKVKALRKELKEASTTYLDDLMRPSQDGVWNGTLAAGATSGEFGSLAPKAREALLMDLTANYRSYGFQSEAEASTSLQNSSISSATYKMTVCSRIGMVGSGTTLTLK